MRNRLFLCLAVVGITCIAATNAIAVKIRAVPTFENCSVYIEDAGDKKADDFKIEYRLKGQNEWQKGHVLTDALDNHTPRTSIFKLKSATNYEVRCLADGSEVAKTSFRTWSEKVPVVRTIVVKNKKGLKITKSGKPTGWIRYIMDPKLKQIEGGYDEEQAILIENVSYIIIDGFRIRGGKRHGILIKKAGNIRITNCDIAGFGRKGELVKKGIRYEPGASKANNWDAGVYLDLAEQILIEHCYIHDPRSTANSWTFGHPVGPNGIFVRAGKKGGLVVRYNDIIGSQEHRWNDAIEAYANGEPWGGFRIDSDIYGNYLAYPNDDCIELEGGMQNIRFYGNKIEGGLCGISTAANLAGPAYIYNNLVVNLGEDRGCASAAVKNGGGNLYSQGVTYFYNNTFLSEGRGITGVGFGQSSNRRMFHGVSRNNILMMEGAGISDMECSPRCSYNYDLFAGAFGGKGGYDIKSKDMEKNAVFGNPDFRDPLHGDISLGDNSSARGAGVAIPGFLSGDKVDMGAVGNDSLKALPWRNAGIDLDKRQLLLKTSSGKAVSATVKVSPAGLKKATKFTILKNTAFPWLEVSPAEGEITPDSSVELKVTFDPSKAKASYLPGAFVVKLKSGESVPVSVYGMVRQEPFGKFYQAVDCEGAKYFDKVTKDGVKCLDFCDNYKNGITIKPDVPADGEYFLYYKVKCPMPFPNHDSIFVRINGSELERCALTASGTWYWNKKAGKTSTVKLHKGVNNILIAQRESIYIAAVYLSAVPVFPGQKLK